MGLRTASVRRPHVVVMAPALTEAAQSQSFSVLPPKTHLQPASPINSFEPSSKYHHSNVKGSYCSEDNEELKSHNESNLKTLILAASEVLEASTRNNNIMNNSPIPMGDQQETMGLQKTGLDSVTTIIKDKSATTSDVDQLLNNITGGVGGGNSDIIGQNVEEIMEAITYIDAAASDERITNNPNSDNEVFPINATDLNNLSSFKELLSDVDMMNISMEEQQDQLEIQSKDLLEEVKKNEVKVHRRLDFLRRRMRKLQARCMGLHMGGEIAGVYEYVHRTLKRLKDNSNNSFHDNINKEVIKDSTSTSEPITENNSAATNTDLGKWKPITFNSTKTLARKLETSAILQANSASRQRHAARYFGSGSIETPSFRSNVSSMVTIPAWPPEYKQELNKVAGSMQAELSLLQQELDSEATESSSGGESCDEMQVYNNPHQQYLSIQKRSLWKYSTERAAIAARWTWLQAQISDLEYRIRQHTDLHKQIRSSKGPVILGGPSPPPSVPSSPTAVNGYRGQLPGNTPFFTKSTDNNTANGAYPDYSCARTRPLVHFKKRKLLQTNGLHAVSKKAARPSTVRCGCVPPTVPCALCTGRTDPTHPRDPPETLSKLEKISLLDPCFHPVFSLPEDISEGIHLDAIMKTTEWQQRSMRIKGLKLLTKGDRLDKPSSEHRSSKLEHRKKYGRLLKPSTVSALSAKIKNKIRGRKVGRHSSLNRLNSRKRHTAKVAMAQLQALAAESVDEEVESIGNNSNAASRSIDSPSSSPLLQMQSISGYNRKNRIDSYDIDNIVIPYSVAAATRVEKLQYKEILTPKWRIADSDFAGRFENKINGAVRNPSQDSDAEDLAEDAVVIRHDKSEHEEKKKFLSYLKLPIGYGRARSHKRTDSLAESSGANTPDPLSPHQLDHLENTTSPITSPPATPLSLLHTEDSTPLPSVSVMRRRTISQSRIKDREPIKEETRCNTPEQIEVPPYEMRTFPLSEDLYDKMLQHMPENHQLQTNDRAQDSREFSSPVSYLDDKLDSPGSESTESALGEEDPNDPEWIDVERTRDRHKR